MDNRQDIRKYSDQELSLLVFNNQDLYRYIHKDYFRNIIDSRYIYTHKQLEVLMTDINADAEEKHMNQDEIKALIILVRTYLTHICYDVPHIGPKAFKIQYILEEVLMEAEKKLNLEDEAKQIDNEISKLYGW